MAGSDFSIDFAAAAPQIYDHDTGGGAFEDKTINIDAVESLEGGDFAVGDIISYYFNVVVDPNPVDTFPQTIEIDVSFLVNTTGQTGVSHRDIVGVSANYYTGEFSVYEDPTSTILIIDDSGLDDDDSTIAWIVPGTEVYESKVTGEVYANYTTAANTQGAVVSATVRLNDLEAGEDVVLRVDTLLDALAGSTPTGNLQGFVTGARVVSPTDDPVINVGNQTIPFKLTGEISGIPEATANLDVEKIVITDFTGFTADYDNNTTNPIDTDAYFESVENESVNVLESGSSPTPTTPTVRYIYEITNNGNTQVDNIFLQDDNGTSDPDDDVFIFIGDNGSDVLFLTDGKGSQNNNELRDTSNGNFQIIGAGFIDDSDTIPTETLEDLDGGHNNANNVENRDYRSLSPGNTVYAYYDVAILDGDYNATSITNTGTVEGSINPNGGGQQGTPISGQDIANINVLDNSSASLSGFTYLDLDNDGVKDADEPGITGALITITNEANSSDTFSIRTDLTGAYLFTGLTDGATYKITQTQPAGYFDGTDTVGTLNGSTGPGTALTTLDSNEINTVVVSAGNYYQDYNFGEILPASISGVAYIDSIDDNNTVSNGDDFAGSDGDRQDTEAGRAGITVTLTGLDDFGQSVNLTSTTDSSGRYYFGDLRPSDSSGYTISFGDGSDLGVVSDPGDIGTITDIQGNTSTVGTAGADAITGVIIGAGGNGTDYDFGLPVSNVGGVISGTVYEDMGTSPFGAANGTDDGLITDTDSSSNSTTPSTGEKRIAGVVIELYNVNDLVNPVATTTTDINGNYSFTNLADATYQVREVQPQYYDPSANNGAGGFVDYLDGKEAKNNDPTSTDVSDNTITNLVIDSTNNDLNLIGNNFGELPPASVSGYVFIDRLNNQDFGLNPAPDPNATPTPDPEKLINSDTGDTLKDINGDDVTVAIDGTATVFTVNVRNGEFDDDEFGLAGINIRLTGTDDEGNAVSLTTMTDANGYYRFDGLRASDSNGYIVTQEQPSTDYFDGIYNFDADLDFSSTEVLSGNVLGISTGTYNDPTVPGETASTYENNFSDIVLNFGQSGVDYNFPEATNNGLITGNVFFDIDGDSTTTGDQTVLSNIQINLLDSGGTVIDTTFTGDDGSYQFINLAADTYTIEQIDLGGAYSDASPADSFPDSNGTSSPNSNGINDRITSITLNAGDNLSDYNFYDTSSTHNNSITGTNSSEELSGGNDDDLITGSRGQDTLTGGAGDDCFIYDETSDGVDIITDFVRGEDLLDFRGIAAGELSGVSIPMGSNLFDEGYINAIPFGTGVMIQVDIDQVDSEFDKNVVFLANFDEIAQGAIAASDFIF